MKYSTVHQFDHYRTCCDICNWKSSWRGWYWLAKKEWYIHNWRRH